MIFIILFELNHPEKYRKFFKLPTSIRFRYKKYKKNNKEEINEEEINIEEKRQLEY